MRTLRLKEYAKEIGVTYRTAWNWVKKGSLPPGVNFIQTKTGTILINIIPITSKDA